MRLRAYTATTTSVVRRSSVCACNLSPIIGFHLIVVVSTRARLLYSDTFCHAMRSCSAMLQVTIPLRGCGLGRAARHGGRMWWDDRGRFRMALGDAGANAVLVVRATVSGKRRQGP